MPVEILRHGAGKKLPGRKLKKIALTILGLLGRDESELSLALIGNLEMQKLNARYRRKDYPTDVLSFPQLEAANMDLDAVGKEIAERKEELMSEMQA